jgi:transcriptional regulator with XRE-family HTH domain
MRGLTLQQVSELTKLSPRVLSRIETGDFSALPAGLQGRAHLRAYARAVGVDAEEIIAALRDRVPVEPDPLEALRTRVRRQFAADYPLTASLRDGAESLGRRAAQVGSLALADRRKDRHLGRRVGAALIDAGIVAGAGTLMLVLSAWLTNSRVDDLWRAAREPIVASCLLAMVLYFTLSRSLGGRSTGTAIAIWIAHALAHRHAHSAARGHAG